MKQTTIDKSVDELLKLFEEYDFLEPNSTQIAEGLYAYFKYADKASVPAKVTFKLKNQKTYYVTYIIRGTKVTGKPSSRGVTVEFKDGSKDGKFLETTKKIWKENARKNKKNIWIIVSDQIETSNDKLSKKDKEWNILLATPESLINMFRKYFTMINSEE